MRRSPALPALCALLAGLVAGCGGASQGSGPAEAPDGGMASGVTGVFHDEAGRPLGGVKVLACVAAVCLVGESDAAGRFSFAIDAPVDLVIKTDGDPSATPRRGAVMVPVRLETPAMVDVGAVHAPDLPEGTPIGPAGTDPQELHAGEGLTLTLHRAALTPRLGDVLVDVAARRLHSDHVPAYAELAGEEVLAVYALHPFAAKSTSPIAVRAPSSLPAGTLVRFRTISEIDGRFSEPVPGRALGDVVVTDPSTGIRELTHLVISR